MKHVPARPSATLDPSILGTDVRMTKAWYIRAERSPLLVTPFESGHLQKGREDVCVLPSMTGVLGAFLPWGEIEATARKGGSWRPIPRGIRITKEKKGELQGRLRKAVLSILIH